MKIIRNASERKQFKELLMGDVFIAIEDESLYMRTSEAYEFPARDEYHYNAVCLVDGSMVFFKEWEQVSIPKEVTLTVDE